MCGKLGSASVHASHDNPKKLPTLSQVAGSANVHATEVKVLLFCCHSLPIVPPPRFVLTPLAFLLSHISSLPTWPTGRTVEVMATLSLPCWHSLPSLLSPRNPKTHSSRASLLLPKSSHSQFHGLRLSSPSSLALPSSSSVKSCISAKVHCTWESPVIKIKKKEGKWGKLLNLCERNAFSLFPFLWSDTVEDFRVPETCRWIKARCPPHSHWKTRTGNLWICRNLRASLWLSTFTLPMRPPAAPNR